MSPAQSAPNTGKPVLLPADAAQTVSAPLSAAGDASGRPAAPLVVFLRGPDASARTWAVLTDLADEQGWVVTRDRTQAWHLARGRMPTVLVDFAAVRLEDAQGPVRIGVGRVLAKYDVTTRRVPVSKLLSAAERGRLADQPWLTTLVEHESREPALPAKGGIATVELPTAETSDVGLELLVEAIHEAAVL